MELIQVTEKAAEYLRTAIAESELGVKGIRFMVQGGGCSGYMHNAVLETADPSDSDWILEKGTLKIFIDPMSAPYLRGTTIDYQTEGFTSGLKFTNPNAVKTCGCGASFSTGD